MLIIELKDTDRWGSTRLSSTEVWGAGVTKKDRERLGNQVVDTFHQKVARAELFVQWQPSLPELVVPIDGDPVPDMALLEQFLDEAYQEVLATVSQVTRVEYSQATGIINPGAK